MTDLGFSGVPEDTSLQPEHDAPSPQRVASDHSPKLGLDAHLPQDEVADHSLQPGLDAHLPRHEVAGHSPQHGHDAVVPDDPDGSSAFAPLQPELDSAE